MRFIYYRECLSVLLTGKMTNSFVGVFFFFKVSNYLFTLVCNFSLVFEEIVRIHRYGHVWHNVQFSNCGRKSVISGSLYFLNLNYILNLIYVFWVTFKSLVPTAFIKN